MLLLYLWSTSDPAFADKHGSDSLDLPLQPNPDLHIDSRPGWRDEITPDFLEMLDRTTQKCGDYVDYATKRHPPFSQGKHRYPYMRPAPKCRTFTSAALEKVLVDFKRKLKDPDLARLLENCWPNTLDTTILWHRLALAHGLDTPETFVVTGDIHAEWLRDSARQLSVFQPLLKHDEQLRVLVRGAIHTQAHYVASAPYCNAFHPPAHSGVKKGESARDQVFPPPDWRHVFECKYEIDSLASFLTLTNEYLEHTEHDLLVISGTWLRAYDRLLAVLQRESRPLFDPESGHAAPFYYSFQRNTNIGSETLPLGGVGNPVNFHTGLVRSAFRPSDDATILQLFVPGNAHMLSELRKTVTNVFDRIAHTPETKRYAALTRAFIGEIERGLKEHAIVDHPRWGRVYAYEVDGYGGAVFMDDANVPSLLSLPEMGICGQDDPVYHNTRRMILSKEGNPYFLKGPYMEGIGGSHIGIRHAWPMSLLMRMRTTDDDEEILRSLDLVMASTAGLGLMHESVNVNAPGGGDYTRPWFAWCNSEFGKTMLHLAVHKPHLIFRDKYAHSPYDIDAVFA
ncbi:hypothetical protein METBIDRAFT_46193 [Metschnikowia bicuspidata var. bicuspidata NRRL YB-4993]|uniref:DUF1237-domain-containing protein n=1 Tax=Metschnikowia bicuspidata var. bicuspidata NRRL YB-4993 TaxID=869754 RepID=A0A1A0H662_9ASCO|nr:hypothetical protein METBIDRAFT_46193 [Metschnikowia bicuspidata var. bicuspidata NRRL YB-4993]OBA19445.1 hypothetical protein METBIDRAFT_46193 [Metschnikowia bicuspidata var. bicuspidata NRRL YB-4993]